MLMAIPARPPSEPEPATRKTPSRGARPKVAGGAVAGLGKMPRAGRLKGMGFWGAAVRVRAVACAGACRGSGAAVLGLARKAANAATAGRRGGGLGALGGAGQQRQAGGAGALRRAGRGGGAWVARRFVGFFRRFVGCPGFKCPAVPVRPAVLNAPRSACQPFFCCPVDPPRAPSPPPRLPAVLMPRFFGCFAGKPCARASPAPFAPPPRPVPPCSPPPKSPCPPACTASPATAPPCPFCPRGRALRSPLRFAAPHGPCWGFFGLPVRVRWVVVPVSPSACRQQRVPGACAWCVCLVRVPGACAWCVCLVRGVVWCYRCMRFRVLIR